MVERLVANEKVAGSNPVSRSHPSLKLRMVHGMYYVYILESSKSKSLYYGYTTDLKKRIAEHNSGNSKYTKGHIPWKLVWYCAIVNRKKAQDFELYLKSGSGKAFVYNVVRIN